VAWFATLLGVVGFGHAVSKQLWLLFDYQHIGEFIGLRPRVPQGGQGAVDFSKEWHQRLWQKRLLKLGHIRIETAAGVTMAIDVQVEVAGHSRRPALRVLDKLKECSGSMLEAIVRVHDMVDCEKPFTFLEPCSSVADHRSKASQDRPHSITAMILSLHLLESNRKVGHRPVGERAKTPQHRG
jgi:hypothetical protein